MYLRFITFLFVSVFSFTVRAETPPIDSQIHRILQMTFMSESSSFYEKIFFTEGSQKLSSMNFQLEVIRYGADGFIYVNPETIRPEPISEHGKTTLQYSGADRAKAAAALQNLVVRQWGEILALACPHCIEVPTGRAVLSVQIPSNTDSKGMSANFDTSLVEVKPLSKEAMPNNDSYVRGMALPIMDDYPKSNSNFGELRLGNLRIDLGEERIYVANKHIQLNVTQYKLLHFLVSHHNEIFTAEELITEVWNKKVGPNTVRYALIQLQAKLVNVKGFSLRTSTRDGGYSIVNIPIVNYQGSAWNLSEEVIVNSSSKNLLRLGLLSLDPVSQKVFSGNREIHFPPKEFQILKYFMENKERAVSVQEIQEKVWQTPISSAAVQKYISTISEKISSVEGIYFNSRLTRGGYSIAEHPSFTGNQVPPSVGERELLNDRPEMKRKLREMGKREPK